jgi:hypothetical protein
MTKTTDSALRPFLQDIANEMRAAYQYLQTTGLSGHGADLVNAALKIVELARAEQARIEALRRRGSFAERVRQMILDEITALTGRRPKADLSPFVLDMTSRFAVHGQPLDAESMDYLLRLDEAPPVEMVGELRAFNPATGTTTIIRGEPE